MNRCTYVHFIATTQQQQRQEEREQLQEVKVSE